jgi:hypothetical protein
VPHRQESPDRLQIDLVFDSFCRLADPYLKLGFCSWGLSSRFRAAFSSCLSSRSFKRFGFWDRLLVFLVMACQSLVWSGSKIEDSWIS